MEKGVFRLVGKYREEAPVAVGTAGVKTGKELREDICAVAEALPEAATKRQVLVLCEDSYYFVVAICAAWQRRLSVALPPNAKPKTLEDLTRSQSFVAVLNDRDGPGLDVRTCKGRTDGRRTQFREIASGERIATLYTSGSTGESQICPKTAGQLLGESEVLARHFGVQPEDCVLSTVPDRHIYGLLYGVLMPMSAGARFVRDTPFHAETVADFIRRFNVDTLVSVPAHLRGLLNLPEGSLPVARVFSSGAEIPETTVAKLSERFNIRVTEAFGSSETGGIAYRDALSREPWRTLPGVEVAADDDGRLLVTSPFIDQEQGSPYRCDDRVDIVGDGRFHHIGREDGVVKIGGVRVSEKEVEQRILALPGVEDAAVVSVKVDGPRGCEIWAAMVAPGWNARRLRKSLREWLEPVALPRRIRFVSSLPRQATGKLNRDDLKALFKREKPRLGGKGKELSFDIRSHEERLEKDYDCHDFEVLVPQNLLYFEGHFEGNPVLPGIVQLNELVLERAENAWPDLGHLQRIDRLKFQHPIRPGDSIRLELRRRLDSTQIRFRISLGERPCASGVLLFAVKNSR
jgi:4-coumarate--CoA ligase (photoactive yellow protein activation family)